MPGPGERRGTKLALSVHRRASEDSVGTLAAALTYSAFLSLFPLVLLGLSAVGFLLAGDRAAQREWVDRLSGAIPGLGPLVGRNIEAVVDGRAGTGVVGLLGAVWTATGLGQAAQEALGRIFRTASRGAVRRRFRSFATTGGLGVLALASVALTGLAAGWRGGGAVAVVLRALGIAAGVVIDLGFFLVAYRSLTPGRRPGLLEHLPGAALTAAGWTTLKLAGSLYTLRVVGRATALYGTVGAVFGLLAVLHLATRLFLYGAELSAVLMERREPGPE
ncbi:MAG: YihY/virulence factor BrkB family protein [Actinobacteria bacterium]|nr:YihY/virulence factor BrkB family protein [Actinomycetota bacterium]